jgi:hypothetical protein
LGPALVNDIYNGCDYPYTLECLESGTDTHLNVAEGFINLMNANGAVCEFENPPGVDCGDFYPVADEWYEVWAYL